MKMAVNGWKTNLDQKRREREREQVPCRWHLMPERPRTQHCITFLWDWGQPWCTWAAREEALSGSCWSSRRRAPAPRCLSWGWCQVPWGRKRKERRQKLKHSVSATCNESERPTVWETAPFLRDHICFLKPDSSYSYNYNLYYKSTHNINLPTVYNQIYPVYNHPPCTKFNTTISSDNFWEGLLSCALF